jgi:hypothetical protein
VNANTSSITANTAAINTKQTALIAGAGITISTNIISVGQSVTTTSTPTFAGINYSGSTSGAANIVAPAIAGTTTITLPAATGTLATIAGTETFTNKTLVTPIIDAATGTSLTLTGSLSAGSSSVTSLTVSGNQTIGGTLGVTGTTTLSSASMTGNVNVGGNLAVTGATTLTGTSAHGGAATFSSTVNVTGATTLSTLTATGNATLTSLTATGAATFSGTVTIPSGAGLNRVLTSNASGLASWSANPNTSIVSVTSSTTYTVSANDKYVIYSNATTGTITLPDATSSGVNAGKEYIIKNISGNSITINTTSSQKIILDNANNTAITITLGVEASNNWVRVISDGTQWIGFRALF